MGSFLAILLWTSLAALAYTSFGYMLIVRLLAGVRQGRDVVNSAPSEWPTVTLIIPAYNEERILERRLHNALEIDYPRERLEIIVASDGSSDRTVAIASALQGRGIKVLAFTERRGKTAVLNESIAQAAGDVICVSDANVMFRRDALKSLAARLEEPGVGAVSGDVRLASAESDFGEGELAYYGIERTVQLAESAFGSMMGVDGGMYALRRSLFQPIPEDTILDDFVISMRVIRQGNRVVFEPSAVATENATATAREEFGRRVRLSAGAMQVLKRGEWPPLRRPVELWQFVSHKAIRWAGPLWLGIAVVSGSLLWNVSIVYRIVCLTQAFAYLISAAGGLSTRLRQTRLGGIAFYFVMSHIAMTVGTVKGLLNLQRVTWKRTERTTACRETPLRTTAR